MLLLLSEYASDLSALAILALDALSFLMIRDLDAVRFAVKGSYDRADRVDVARLYARQVEHSENNLEYLAEEFIFEEVYSPESLQAALLQP